MPNITRDELRNELRDIIIINREKIDAIQNDISEIKRTLECLVGIKKEIAVHNTYFKILGFLSGGMLTLVVGLILKII